ncbi:MAG: VCBS repeat-containing protein [Ignavibacteria bacterium]|nr:VCBS repeat-containing protein [Ignavibacteria bacterium]
MKKLTAKILILFLFITSGLNAQTGGILNSNAVDYSKNFPMGMTTDELNKIVNLPKGAQDKFRGPEVTDQNGGPDAYGYKWIDSDDPGGPVYNWVEISGVGTPITSWTNSYDDGYTIIALPFAFPFYGTSYNSLKICTNGWVSFDVASSSAVYNNIPIPDASEPNNAIMPFWDDLYIETGNVYYYNDAANNRFIIQYNNVPHYSGGSEGPGPYTFEVILKKDGGILFQYKSVLDPLTSNTIGIENSAGTDGLQIVYNNTYVKNNFAVMISIAPPKITSFSPLSGNIGSTVLINGSGFNSVPANNSVYFGSVKANVIYASATTLGVTVPVSSNYQNISVTNLAFNLTGYSNLPFNITFPGGCKPDLADGIGYNNAGFGIEKIRTVDFDGDGNSDILVTNGIGASVGVSRVTTTAGVINVAARTDYAIGGQPGSICTGDIDGDGKIDIIATRRNSTVLAVFRNTSNVGSISFAARVDFTVGTDPYSVSIGDLDGDGKPDLATANTGFAGSNNVSVLRNVSTPGVISFDPKIDLASGLGPIAICIGDIDGDGKNDLAVAANNTNVSIYRNTSSVSILSFAAPVNFTGGLVMRDMLIGDIDGDGKLDLITDNYNPGNISVLRNTSSSGNVSFASKVDFNAGGFGNQSLAIGDIDGDTKPDLAIAYDNKTIVSICRNISSAGVVNFENKIDFSPPSTVNSYCAAIGDLNQDGKPELLSGNYSGTKLTIFKNNAIATALQTSISGNGNPVVNGSVTPGLTNHTDFGYTGLNTPVVRTFTMQNSSTDSLNINSISTAGGDSALFTAGSISPAGKIAPGTSKTFTVTFNTPSFGTKNTTVKVSSEIMSGTLCNIIQNYTFAVKGEAGTPPVISTSQDTIVSTLLVGSNTETKNFSIGNSGTASLYWSLAENHPLSRPAGFSGIKHTFSDKEINKIINSAKGSRDKFKGPEVSDRSGGPDSFGYKWIDSDSAGGPVFKWTDISGTGTAVTSFTNGNDDGYTIVGLPFSFPYYGVSYPKLKICTNGWVSFDTASTDAAFNNSPIPDSNEPNSIIAPFWDDLDLRSSGNVYYLNDVSNNRFLVQFNNVPHYNSGSGLGPYTFQVILHSNGSIYFQYLNMGSPLNSNTVGIENGAGNDGLQIVYNNTYIHNNLAVQILSPGYNWVSEDPVNGLIAGIGSQNVNLLFNSSSLPVGIYTGNLKITSNDLTNPVKNVAVKLNVISTVPASIKLAIEGFYNAGTDGLNTSDTVRIYLRNSSSPYNIVDSAKSVIDSVTMTGSFLFINAPTGTYYLQAKGRNCIETWSKTGGESYISSSVLNYDFTTANTQAFGNNMIQVDATPVRYGIYSGDVNQDGNIDLTDVTLVFNSASSFSSGYLSTDLTGDNNVDLTDLTMAFNNSSSFVSKKRP